MSYVFLREDDESPGAAVARCALEVLAPGPMGATLRRADYLWFLDYAYADKGEAVVDVATSCAVFTRALLVHAQVRPPKRPPVARAITTWLDVLGFVQDNPDTEELEGCWIPADKLTELEQGDIFYICSDRGSITHGGKVYTWNTWLGALNGHVGACCEGFGWLWRTAEGGGSPGGTTCRLSDEAKDIRKLSRKFQGVFRPRLMPDHWALINAPTEPPP